jgi:hypothetical protein
MKGLALARAYFLQFGMPLLNGPFLQYQERIAAGLVGEGSECFGYDDDLSRDHDFGPGFCFWLPEDLYLEIGPALQAAYDAFPGAYMGVPPRVPSPYSPRRVGVFSISGFYKGLIGRETPPLTSGQWYALSPQSLAAATNGDVFYDPLGEFSDFRRVLLNGYPDQVRNAFLSQNLFDMARAGQCHFPRCMQRKDFAAARICMDIFIQGAVSVAFLLNNRYMPYYKWMFRELAELQELSSLSLPIGAMAQSVLNENTLEACILLMEQVCSQVIRALHTAGLSDCQDSYLLSHAIQVAGHTDCLSILHHP